jgi:hypothetical protein
MTKQLVTKFGEFWQRSDIFEVKDGRVNWTERGWPEKNPPLKGARGIYVLCCGTTPIYVGKAVKGKKGSSPIANRLSKHAQDWYSHAWDNVSWFHFDETVPNAYIEAVEAILIANISGTLNGALPSSHLGKRCFPGNDKNFAKNTLWQKS